MNVKTVAAVCCEAYGGVLVFDKVFEFDGAFYGFLHFFAGG